MQGLAWACWDLILIVVGKSQKFFEPLPYGHFNRNSAALARLQFVSSGRLCMGGGRGGAESGTLPWGALTAHAWFAMGMA